MEPIAATQPAWPLWKKIVFRFFFIYFFLFIQPISLLDYIPGGGYVTRYYNQFNDWMVNLGNRLLFHVRPVLVPLNGSGDTSYGWAQLWLTLTLSAVGCVIWSFADLKRRSYAHLNYWLVLAVRYYTALVAFIYGIMKLFALQMLEPSLHELATTFGDLLPMRLSWLFIGYSTPYQVFSGIMEITAGLLLLYRRTAALGALFGTAVFLNVMMLNLTYDIPVKIFSMQMVLCCLFLVGNDINRIVNFFFLNKPAPICNLYDFRYSKKWQRIAWFVAKLAFVYLAVVQPVIDNYRSYKFVHAVRPKQPVPNGMYDVAVFKVNGDMRQSSFNDSVRWQNVIFQDGWGSIKVSDTAFWVSYKRSYFNYVLDSAANVLNFKKFRRDSLSIISFHYAMPDSNTIQLWGVRRSDSLFVELKKMNVHFQLAEKQFHWLSEANR